MLPAFIVAGGVALFAVTMTVVCYVIVRHEQHTVGRVRASPPP